MTFEDPYDAMQAAVNIVGSSEHPTNKISAALFGKHGGLTRTNYWPGAIVRAFGRETDIGNSSGTLHAETACILAAQIPTDGTSLCITDPFCPNCAKNIAEAGVKTIYIDHKGFDKDFFQRRGGHFDAMSMRICEKAGISVYELWRKDERLVPIYEAPKNYIPHEECPIIKEPIGTASEAIMQDVVAQGFKIHQQRKFAVAFVTDKNNKCFALTARGHPVIGFTMGDPDDLATLENGEDKYSFFQEPVNRMMMYTARYGLKILDDYFFCSQVPTSREQVNLVGAGIKRITVGDIKKSRDADALKAMQQLSQALILTYT